MKPTPRFPGRLLLLLAILPSPIALADGGMIPPPAPGGSDASPMLPTNPDAKPWPTNLLVVEADTGRIMDWQDRRANLTDIRLLGVQPDTVGFTLHSPSGKAPFRNQASTPEGYVEFWHIPFEIGLWSVTLEAEGITMSVSSFQVNADPGAPTGGIRGVLHFLSSLILTEPATSTLAGPGGPIPANESMLPGSAPALPDAGPSTASRALGSSSCTFSGDYGACTFRCAKDASIHIRAYDPTDSEWRYPRTHVRCGGVDAYCQAYQWCEMDVGPASYSEEGVCYSETISNEGSCSSAPESTSRAPATVDADVPTNPNPQLCTWSIIQTYTGEHQNLWTPILIAHAPYGGSATASSGWSEDTATYVAPFGYGSTVTAQAHLSTTDGVTNALFRAADWGLYRIDAQDSPSGCGGGPRTSYTSKVINWWANDWGTDIYGADRRTDADDQTNVGQSIHFDQRYRSMDALYQNSGSQPQGYSTSSQQLATFGGGVSFSVGYIAFDAISYQATTTTTEYYDYTFNPGGSWSIDWLGTPQQMWAFCRRDLVTC